METNCICNFCGKDIYKNRISLKKHKKHFCDANCQKKHIRGNSKILKTICDYCGIKIEKTSNQQRHSRTGLFFCGNLCKNRFISQKKRWLKDDVESHRIRRKILCERAKHTCQVCGYNDGEDNRMLDIHHYDHNHKNNKFENLRVLCVWCHIKHHRLKIEYNLSVIMTQEAINTEIDKYQKNRKEEYLKKNEKLKITKLCSICDKNFITENKNQKYCSNQCSTFSYRKIKRPTKEKLIHLIRVYPMTAIGKKYSVSDNAIRKWAKSYDINIKEVKQNIYVG